MFSPKFIINASKKKEALIYMESKDRNTRSFVAIEVVSNVVK